MRRADLQKLTIDKLLERYVAIGEAEEDAALYGDIAGYNQLFRKEQDVVDELQSRAGDQRRLLLGLYDHENLWIRLSAVKNSLVFAPEEGRRVLQEIADSMKQPYAGDAGMTLRALDRGIFRPE